MILRFKQLLKNTMQSTLLAISLLLLFSCSNDKEITPPWCGSTGIENNVNGIQTVVFKNGSKSMGLVLDTVLFGCDSLPIVLKPDEHTAITRNLNVYVGDTVRIYGHVVPPYTNKKEILNINGVKTPSAVYELDYMAVGPNNTLTRGGSGEGGLICGTIGTAAEYKRALRISKMKLNTSDLNKFGVYVYVHVLRSLAGVGYDKNDVCTSIMRDLNSNYKAANIDFTLLGSEYLDIIDDNIKKYATMPDITNNIFSINRHINCIDIYVLSGVYSWPISGISQNIPGRAFILYNEAFRHTTPSHEMGHCLGLFHTHHGTDIDERNESTIPELVDGSNSKVAGDLISDTPADPNNWNSEGEYDGKSKDANGDKYRPDPANHMSYSGVSTRFSKGQFDMIRKTIAANDTMHHLLKRSLSAENAHLNKNGKLSILNTEASDVINWTVSTRSSINGAAVISKHSGDEITVKTDKSAILKVTADISLSQGLAASVSSDYTVGPPSPSIGELHWDAGAQSGATRSDNFGMSLYVGGNTNVKFEYNDPIAGSLQGVTYRCVTATHRVLSGTSMTFTQADCADGFLKIRAYDDCGMSDEYFTILTDTYGSYYSITFGNDGKITFKGETGSANASKLAKSAVDAPKIKSIRIYDASRKLVYSQETESTEAVSLPSDILGNGEYTAVISDGSYGQEIIFGI